MPKGKQSYVPGLGKKSVARHSGEVRKPVSIALSTQFSTRLAPGLQFTLAVNERLTFWCRLRNVFEEVFEKGFRRCRLRASRNIGENFMPGQPSGANENASETQGDPSGEQPPVGLKTPSHEQREVRMADEVISLCFNSLAWFTYWGDFLWRTSRMTTRNRSLKVNQ